MYPLRAQRVMVFSSIRRNSAAWMGVIGRSEAPRSGVWISCGERLPPSVSRPGVGRDCFLELLVLAVPGSVTDCCSSLGNSRPASMFKVPPTKRPVNSVARAEGKPSAFSESGSSQISYLSPFNSSGQWIEKALARAWRQSPWDKTSRFASYRLSRASTWGPAATRFRPNPSKTDSSMARRRFSKTARISACKSIGSKPVAIFPSS